MRYDSYKRLAGKGASLIDLLYYSGADEIEFDPPRLTHGPIKMR